MTTSTNPNHTDKSRSDAKSPMGVCSLMKNKVQLLPLRYGLVERLDPSAELALPYKLKSRPVGMRLLRDGWLYVIDNGTGYLHEYRVEQGKVTKFLWKGNEAAQDKRLGNVAEPRLVFPRGATLHVGFSEVQWTAFKCSQMLKSRAERDLFMQVVDLGKADCEKGGAHLLTAKQAEKWLAEVAEKPAQTAQPTGAHPEEGKDYCWEHQPLYRRTQLGEIKKALAPAYEHDHFYLVLKDSIGVMRDLAEEQDKVVGWIDDWVGQQRKELKYVIGSYIETLMVANDGTARQAGASDALFKKTTPAQREKIYAYIEARDKWLWERRRLPVAQKVNGYYTRNVVLDPRTIAAKQEMEAQKQAMIDALGEDLYDELEDDIEKLEDQHDGALEGKGWGARGIHDLVRHEEMKKYLEDERVHLKRWTARLDRITADRLSIFTKGEFHRSAWYFDPEHPDQLMAALVTEQNCVRDLCRTEESLKAVGEYFHKYPYYILPAFAGRLDGAFLGKKSNDLVKWLDDLRNFKSGLADAQARLQEVERLMGSHWTRSLNLSPAATSASQAVNAAYIPAIALRLENWLAGLQDQLNGPALRQHLDKLASQTNRAHRLGTLIALKQEGATLAVASEQDAQLFRLNLVKLNQLLQSEDELIKARNRAQAQSRRRLLSEAQRQAAKLEKQQLNRQLGVVRQQRTALVNQQQESLTPTSTLPAGFVGARLKLDPALQSVLNEEIRRLRAGMRGGYGTAGTQTAALKGGLLPLAAVGLQVWNLKETIEDWRKISGPSGKELGAFLGALAGAASAALSVYQTAHISMVDKALQATVASTAGKGGMLFAVRLGKLGLGLGVIISPLAFISSVGTVWDNWSKWTDAFRTGTAEEKAGALMVVSGDLGATSVNAAITGKAFWELGGIALDYHKALPGQRAAALSMAWATRGARFLNFSARLSPWGLAFTALQLGGEALYNYFNLDDQQRWMLGCCWGMEEKGWDWPAHAQGLAEANLRPVIEDKGLAPRASDGESVRTLQLTLPGVSLASLSDHPLVFTAEWHAQISRPPEDVGAVISENLRIAETQPLTLALELPADWCGSQCLLMLRLAVQPELANQPLKASDAYLYYRIPLEMASIAKSTKGEPSIKPSGTPLRWIEVKLEHLHA
ncbi:hypothetical protein JQR85_01655 [Stutzerimonas urumqiensis]|uniref:toxin VasX n=1 Tax=Stutzerimonas urumqiensis TaxID=638269 RepID=UPI003DA3F554